MSDMASGEMRDAADPYRRPDASAEPTRTGAPRSHLLASGNAAAGATDLPDAARPDGAVRVDEVTVAYGSAVAVSAASLVAAPGTVLALTGPSGAGKSTLLWAIAGAVLPKEGEVTVGGARITDRPSGIRADVALIPQGNGLAGVLTAHENIAYPLLARGASAREAATLTGQALADVGLEESGNHLVEELSGGQQQRVAVARGLAGSPAVLLADEPTSELDHVNRGKVLDLLRDHASRGAVVIMATHDPEAAASADYEVRLDEGQLSVIR